MLDYLTILFSLVIGIAAILTSWKLIKLFLETGKWNRVEAKVLSKEVVFNNLSRSPRTPYTVLIEYSYQINNKDYRGSKLDLVELIGGFSSYRKPIAEERMGQIKEKEMVYVNPNDHAQSVMNRKGITLYLIVFIMGLFALLFGIAKFF